jgi:hypothetical protein
MHELIRRNEGDFSAQLDALGEHHARASTQDSSCGTYKSGIRMRVRFRLGVQRRGAILARSTALIQMAHPSLNSTLNNS